MLIETQTQPIQRQQQKTRPARWRIVAGVLVTLLTVWFIQQTISWTELQSAFAQAVWQPVWVGIGSIIATIAVKAIRWRLLFRPKSTRPTLQRAFDALMLNQFVNLIFFVRIGEVARVYHLRADKSAETAQAVGTIVVEKWLELFVALLTLLGLFTSYVALPDGLSQRATRYGVLVVCLIVVLLLVAFQHRHILTLTNRLYAPLPAAWRTRLQTATTAGLQGLAALREPQAILQQLLLSIAVMALYIATPYVLFAAFALPYTLFDAVVLHTSIGLLTAIPATPGKFGLIEVSTLAILQFLNPDIPETRLLSYAIVYHLVIITPPLIWGGLIALRSDWSWKIA